MEAITNLSVRMVQRYLPSAFVLAVILTAIVFVLGMTVSGPVARGDGRILG